MREIWWVRHGSTDWNAQKRWQGHSDILLNAEGKQQAQRLAPHLKGIPFTQIWSSDLKRSLETAQLAMPGQSILTDARLREIPMGVAEGKIWSEISEEDQQAILDWWTHPYSTLFPGANESLADVTNRVKAWREELPEDGRFLVFTHGGIVRTVFWEMVGQPLHKEWTMELGNTGIVRIRYDRNLMTLVTFNDMSHVPDSWSLPPCQNVPGN